jgi:hypothetical protein
MGSGDIERPHQKETSAMEQVADTAADVDTVEDGVTKVIGRPKQTKAEKKAASKEKWGGKNKNKNKNKKEKDTTSNL